jgi:hypothetical protein
MADNTNLRKIVGSKGYVQSGRRAGALRTRIYKMLPFSEIFFSL